MKLEPFILDGLPDITVDGKIVSGQHRMMAMMQPAGYGKSMIMAQMMALMRAEAEDKKKKKKKIWRSIDDE